MPSTTAEQRKANKAKRTSRFKSTTDDYGNTVNTRMQRANSKTGAGPKLRNFGTDTGTPKSFKQKANTTYQQTMGRVRSKAGKAGLYDVTKGKLTKKGKIGVGIAAGLGVAGVGAAAMKRRNEKKKQAQMMAKR